jgi:ABC-2 type transport system ATP-binding protein
LNISSYDFLYQLALLVRDDKEQIKIELDEWIKKLSLESEIKRNPNKLSSGQVKKILLIRAALEKSEIIILDEPAAFLDPTSRLQFFELLKELNNQGVTIFISSHILDEIKKYIDSVTFIKQGEIKWSGKIEGKDLIKKYKEIIIDNEF